MEEWKDILGWEDLYEISTMGQVRSKRFGGRLLKGNRYKSGHMVVSLPPRFGAARKSKSNRNFYIHRLLLETFDRPAEDWEECRHLNSKPWDNRLENLAWGSRSENALDIKAHWKLDEIKALQEEIKALKLRLARYEPV